MTDDGSYVIWIQLEYGQFPVMSFHRMDDAREYIRLHTPGMRRRLWIEDVETGTVVTEGR